MDKAVNVQNLGPSQVSTKPVVLWLTLVLLSCVCTALIAQPSMYL